MKTGSKKTKTTKIRKGDLLVTTTTTVESAVIDFQDILDAVVIEDDEMCEAPWHNCDGLEHKAVPAEDVENAKEHQGYAWSTSNREAYVITLAPIQNDEWGIMAYRRALGQSKQVAYEAAAQNRQKTIKQLVEWYENGWNYYGVTCEYEGEEASVWGVDDYEYADTEVRREIAGEVAYNLEKAGYKVVNYPKEEKKLTTRRLTKAVSADRGVHEDIYPRSMTVEAWKAHYKSNLNLNCWSDK